MKKLNKKFVYGSTLTAQKHADALRASCYCYPTCTSQCASGGVFAQAKLDVGWIVNKDYNANN